MISPYVPAGLGNEEAKYVFYEELELVYDASPCHCIILLLGNKNAQVEKENAYKVTIGIHDRSNDNGIRLITFEISKNVLISSTRFLKKLSIKKRGYPQEADLVAKLIMFS